MTIDDRDRAGRTELHYAVKHTRHDLPYIAAQTDPGLEADNLAKNNEFKLTNTRALLDAGADVNAVDQEGYTPLHFAAADDSVDVVRLLLDAGADVDAAASQGETPLYAAVRNTTPAAFEIIRLLRDRGADPTAETAKGSSALKFIRRFGKPHEKELFADLL